MINNNYNTVSFGSTFDAKTLKHLKRKCCGVQAEHIINEQIRKIAEYGDKNSKYNTIHLGIEPDGTEAFYLSDGASKGWRITGEFLPRDILAGFLGINDYEINAGQKYLKSIEGIDFKA